MSSIVIVALIAGPIERRRDESWSALEENQTVFLTIIISYSMHLDDVVPRLFPAVIWIE
jgi:hypothetical protein